MVRRRACRRRVGRPTLPYVRAGPLPRGRRGSRPPRAPASTPGRPARSAAGSMPMAVRPGSCASWQAGPSRGSPKARVLEQTYLARGGISERRPHANPGASLRRRDERCGTWFACTDRQSYISTLKPPGFRSRSGVEPRDPAVAAASSRPSHATSGLPRSSAISSPIRHRTAASDRSPRTSRRWGNARIARLRCAERALGSRRSRPDRSRHGVRRS